VWTLRNIFSTAVAGYPDLEKYIVVRHHEDLDLDQPPERETELIEEFKALRERVQAQRQLKRTYKLALIKAKIRRRRLEALEQKLSFIDNPLMDELLKIPEQLQTLGDLVKDLPPMDAARFAAQLPPSTEPGKRPWETSQTGYLNWAVGQLISRTRLGATPGIDALYQEAQKTGTTSDLKGLLEHESAAS
jgi:kinetochore protein Mis12/MTW1